MDPPQIRHRFQVMIDRIVAAEEATCEIPPSARGPVTRAAIQTAQLHLRQALEAAVGGRDQLQ